MGKVQRTIASAMPLFVLAIAAAFVTPLPRLGVSLAASQAEPPQMLFGPKGDPVAVELKTMNGVKSVKGRAGGKMIDVMGASGLKFGCKSGECGTCEAKLDGRVVRTCVAKLPNKPTVKIDVTQNKVLKSRRSSNF